MSASAENAGLWDRLYVVATIVLAVFICAGIAQAFADTVVAWGTPWPTENSSTHPWVAVLDAMHGQGVWTRVLMLPLVAWISVVCVFEGRRGAAYARSPKSAEALPYRMVQIAASIVKPLVWSMPALLLYVVSGAQLTLRTSPLPSRPTRLVDLLSWLHAHAESDPILPWFALLAGALVCVLIVLVGRVRAARLQALGVRGFRLYEDLPQGAVLATISALLSTLTLMAWGGPLPAVPLVFLVVFVSMLLAHLLPVVSESPAWRWFPFVFVFLLVLGDVVRGGVAERGAWTVWGFAFALAFVAVVVARVHRRALYRASDEADA